MERTPSETDWQLFRELSALASRRFCERALVAAEALCRDRSRSVDQRWSDLRRHVRESERSERRAFGELRRSSLLQQLLAMSSLGLLEPDELARFSSDVRKVIEGLGVAPE